MKYIVFTKEGKYLLKEMPIPEISDDEILVKVERVGVCTGELMDWYVKKKAPYTPGHEISGIVSKVGKNVHKFKEGDKVFVHHHAPCMECKYCLKGEYTSCPTWRKQHIFPGGLSEYIRVSPFVVNYDSYKLEGISLDDGALIEPLACSVKAFRKSNVKPTDKIAIIGLGFMGLLNAKLFKVMTSCKVVCFELSKERMEFGKRWAGCDEVIHPDEHEGESFDVVIVGPPSKKAINFGLKIADRGARVILFAPLPSEDNFELNVFHMYFNEITLIPSYSCSHEDTYIAFKLIKSGKILPSQLITHKFKIEDTQQAYMKAKELSALKVMIEL